MSENNSTTLVPVVTDEEVLSLGQEAEVRSISIPMEEDLSRLLRLADTAEERADSLKKIKLASLKVTSPSDWVDQEGSPYLQCSGAEKVARLWGINWKILGTQKVLRDDFYMFVVTLRVWSQILGEIEVVGTRSSRDPFFGKRRGELVPMLQVDEAAVLKAAYTNSLVNGITRLVGVRGLTWEELGKYGTTQDKAQRIERFQRNEQTDDERGRVDEIRNKLIELCGGDAKAALAKLTEITTFTGKDGEPVPGLRSFSDLRGKRLDVTLGKVRRLHDGAFQSFEPEEAGDDR